MTAIDPLLLEASASVRDLIACIDRNAKGIAVVVDAEGCLEGTLTDGDVRRAILAGIGLEGSVSDLLARKSDEPHPRGLTANVRTSDAELIHLMNVESVRHIPLVDDQNRVVDLVVQSDLLKEYEEPLTAVVMAGGYGTRLGSLTRDTPKPMLPVGGRPVLEHIVDQLRESGITRVNLATHFRADVISEHFGDGRDFGVEIGYVDETEPLGTAGGLGLLPESDAPVLVMNGDILTRVDVQAMLEFHREHKAAMTMAVRQEDIELASGVVEVEGELVKGIQEKPTIRHFVNAGIYLIDPIASPCLPRGERMEMPELVERLLKHELPVASFPLREYWLDIGLVETYEQAARDHESGRLQK